MKGKEKNKSTEKTKKKLGTRYGNKIEKRTEINSNQKSQRMWFRDLEKAKAATKAKSRIPTEAASISETSNDDTRQEILRGT